MRQLLTMTLGDLRQRVRDRSVLIFGVVVPLALMGVLNLVMGNVQDVQLKPTTVAAAVPDGDPLADTVVRVLDDLEAFEVTVERVDAGEVRDRVDADQAHLGLTVPDGFTAAVTAGEPVEVVLTEGDGIGIEGDVVASVLEGMLGRFSASAVAAGAGAASGVPPQELQALAEQVATASGGVQVTAGETAREQLSASGTLVAGQSGLFMVFTVGFGVLALITEKDQGTLARLRSMPMHPRLIVSAKALSSFLLGLLSTSVLLTIGSRLFAVDFGSLLVVGVLVASAVAATTSLMFVVVKVARTAEQAGVAQSVLAMVLGIAGGAFFPLAASGWLAVLLDLNPVAAFIRGLGISAGGGGLADVAVPVAFMLGFAAVVAGLAALLPDKGVAQ